jgi:hypothetical protein
MQEFTIGVRNIETGLRAFSRGVRNNSGLFELLNLEPMPDKKLRESREVRMPIIREQAPV